MNDGECKDCLRFHQRGVGERGGMRNARYGWCAAKSVYCESDPDIPEGAQTTKESVAKPYIVRAEQVVRGCPDRRTR